FKCLKGFTSFLCFSKKKIKGNVVHQEDSLVYVKEKASIKLACNYTTSNASPYLYWYQQYPGDSLKFILHKNKHSSLDSAPGFSRFDAELGKDDTFHLTIENVEITDSAVYFCAFSP
uniref:Ig-like domain-containing protein n=1 Tax=Latimeria chalumnae TaxID=7897 RepID=H3AT87_LATCH